MFIETRSHSLDVAVNRAGISGEIKSYILHKFQYDIINIFQDNIWTRLRNRRANSRPGNVVSETASYYCCVCVSYLVWGRPGPGQASTLRGPVCCGHRDTDTRTNALRATWPPARLARTSATAT